MNKTTLSNQPDMSTKLEKSDDPSFPQIIYHIVSQDEWERVVDIYTPDSLSAEGFIHCSTAEQVEIAGNNHFRGQTGLILLEIDTTKVSAPIVYEDLYETGINFPHIYGTLLRTSVIATHPFESDSNGHFLFPT